MTYHDTHHRNDLTHQQVCALLSWYVNGTLEGHEHDDVETHLTTCDACQEELARCRELAEGVQATEEVSWTPSPHRLSRLLSRIDAAETRSTWTDRWRDYLGDLWQRTPPFVRGAMVAQGALLLLLASMLISQAVMAPAALYHTLADGSASVSQDRGDIRVVFTDETTAQEMRQILAEISGTIVSGPSPFGVYTVEVTSMASSSEPMSLVLSAMRAHQQVRLAEPALAR